MLVVCGMTASGKDTVVKEIETLGLERIVTTTTRPPRPGEIDGVDYHFITDEEFETKVDNGFFAEFRSYVTTAGVWKYGSSKQSYFGDKVIILDKTGLESIKDNNIHNIVACLLRADDEVVLERQIKRGDNKEEAERRFKADKKAFEGIEDIVDFTIVNNGQASPKLLASAIVSAYYGNKYR